VWDIVIFLGGEKSKIAMRGAPYGRAPARWVRNPLPPYAEPAHAQDEFLTLGQLAALRVTSRLTEGPAVGAGPTKQEEHQTS